MVKKLLGSSGRYLLNLFDRPAVILLYHRVTHLKTDPQLLSVTPENFNDHVTILKKKYNLLNIDEFTEIIIHQKKFPPHAVVITFDDGYLDNLYEAIPILESLQAQALFYITTSNINTKNELWWDELERIFLLDNNLPPSITIETRKNKYQFPSATPKEKQKAYDTLHPILKFTSIPERNKTLDHLRSLAGLPTEGRPTHRMLTTEELKKMSKSSAAVIGAHTVNHPALAALNYDEQLTEIKLSKKFLEKTLDQKIDHFSYPFGGKKDYNKNSIEACNECGFKIVCANYYNQVHSWTDLFQLPRMLVRNWNKQIFEQRMENFFRY